MTGLWDSRVVCGAFVLSYSGVVSLLGASALVKDRISLREIFAGCGWFLVCEALVLSLLVAFQDISLWLPRALGLL
jgi:TRAP-type C4-dicarboxylate transport system permease large subunit